MKNSKKIIGLMSLVFAAMMFTSCKAKIGGGEFSIVWQILAIIVWGLAASEMGSLLPQKESTLRRICGLFNFLLLVCGIAFPFVWAPLPYIPKISLCVAVFFLIISLIRGSSIKAKKTEEEKKAQAEAAAAKKEELQKESVSLYNETLPKVKRYLDSVGFELPPDENVFFMQIDPNTGKWKYEVTYDLDLKDWVKNNNYSSGSYNHYDKCKYRTDKVKKTSPSANGILLTADGKAYIGAVQGNRTFWWHTEDGEGIDNSFQPEIHTVLAVGNITKQLLCGLHIKIADETKVSEDDKLSDTTCFSNTPDTMLKDYYWCSDFPKSVKRVFVLPSDEYEKKNTVTLGAAFNECSNLRLFYMGFNKCEHEKFLCENNTYKVFANDSHAEFISPSKDCQEFFNAEKNCKNWEFKVGTTIQNAVSITQAVAAEKEAAIANAKKAIEESKKKEAEENAAKLAETKAALAQMESDLEAKKAEVATLGMDAQAIVKKAKLNKEIKELEPQIETLKAEVERLSK